MKSVKRFLCAFLCLFMLLPSFSALVFAQDEPTVYAPIEFTVTSAKGVEDKTVHVEVRVSENSQIASMNLELLFDSSKLLVNRFEAGELFDTGLYAINGNVSDKVIASYASMEPITNAGTLFSVDFTVTADVNETLDLDLNVVELTDINSNDLMASGTTAGTIEVVDLLYGDLNFDNRVGAVDALMVLSYATEEIGFTGNEKKAADVNGDGKVSVSDALQILYFSAELIDDFRIYQVSAPKNVRVSGLDGYQFTVDWDYEKDVFGYNVYLDGEKVNEDLITENSVSIGVNMAGEYGSDLIPHRIQDKIEQVTTYSIEITAVNALKESEKSPILMVTTKRIWSWVTFNDWDGTLLKKARVYYGEDAIEPNAPTREDYFFTGWDKPTTGIIDDTVITATYEDAHYNFIFRNEDGTELYRQDVTVNGKATPPADPQKTGYSFSGWYTLASGGTKVTDFAITSATGERTVYAQYSINSYTVNFDSTGGSAVTSKTAVYHTSFSAPTAPTRLGYGFAGWYADKACTRAWNFSANVIEHYDLTLYAKWTPVTITIDKAAVTLNSVGSTAQLIATISGGTDSLEWFSDNTSVATVSSSGKITAVGHGTAVIYVKGVASDRRPVTTVAVNVEKAAWCTGDTVCIRQTPGTGAVLGYLNSRDKISTYGGLTNAGLAGQTGWYYIKAGSTYGYVSADYLTFTEPPAFMPIGKFGAEYNYNGTIYYTFPNFRQYIASQLVWGWPGGCAATSAAMVDAMIRGVPVQKPTSGVNASGVVQNWSTFLGGFKRTAVDNEQQVLIAAKNELVNNGRPCLVHFPFYSSSTGWSEHWVVIVGIKKGANAESLQRSDFLIIDPYESYVSEKQIRLLSKTNTSGIPTIIDSCRVYMG